MIGPQDPPLDPKIPGRARCNLSKFPSALKQPPLTVRNIREGDNDLTCQAPPMLYLLNAQLSLIPLYCYCLEDDPVMMRLSHQQMPLLRPWIASQAWYRHTNKPGFLGMQCFGCPWYRNNHAKSSSRRCSPVISSRGKTSAAFLDSWEQRPILSGNGRTCIHVSRLYPKTWLQPLPALSRRK
jgi:hypothetical protein